jgi:ribosomal protein L14E/L6E/L27E
MSKAQFTRFVEPGRVAWVNFGKKYGSLLTILEIIDQNRVLVDSEAGRQEFLINHLSLTKEVLKGVNSNTTHDQIVKLFEVFLFFLLLERKSC